MGRRIADMRLAATGVPIEAGKEYVVSGWGSVSETVEGPPVWDVLATYLKDRPAVAARSRQAVSIVRTSP
jgi:sulfur-oxidizing protein SoxB